MPGALFLLEGHQASQGAKRALLRPLRLHEDGDLRPAALLGVQHFLTSSANLALKHLRLEAEQLPRFKHGWIGLRSQFHAGITSFRPFLPPMRPAAKG
jgi:hypothetical protein